jgi:N-acetylglucosamine-6-sulfatase
VSRIAAGFVLALAVVASAAVAASVQATPPADDRPNIVVVLTDDQTFESLPHDPPVMPYLQSQIADPAAGWIWFPNAFVNTPLCCPSRATILTGRFSSHTGVQGNDEGALFEDSSTVATWLHAAGYRTGLVGKYLNGYPFGRSAFVPPGWDHFLGKENTSDATVYRRYTVVDDGIARTYGAGPEDYATSVLSRDAVSFIRSTPPGQPFFLMFAPSAPHRPWIPPPGEAGVDRGMAITNPPGVGERDVSDKPAWVRALPSASPAQRATWRSERRSEYETLRGVDDAMRSIDEELRARGDAAHTIVIYLTDNGYAFGEHRWESKSCPYEPCVRVPFFVRVPGVDGHTDQHLVSNVDLASTIAALARVRPRLDQDGTSLTPLLGGAPGRLVASGPRRASILRRRAVLLEFAGGGGVPAWDAVRTKAFLWVDLSTGEHELYDLAGAIGPADPAELRNRADDPDYAAARRRLEGRLRALLAE